MGGRKETKTKPKPNMKCNGRSGLKARPGERAHAHGPTPRCMPTAVPELPLGHHLLSSRHPPDREASAQQQGFVPFHAELKTRPQNHVLLFMGGDMRSCFAEEFTATDEKIREIFWCRKCWIGRKKTSPWEAGTVLRGAARSVCRSEYNFISLGLNSKGGKK